MFYSLLLLTDEKNKSFREIAKVMHMSFCDIGAIINKWKERENG